MKEEETIGAVFCGPNPNRGDQIERVNVRQEGEKVDVVIETKKQR